VFGLHAALGCGGMVAAVASVATALASLQHAPGSAHGIELAGLRFTYPTINLAALVLLLLAAVGVIVLALAVRATWGQRRAYRRFVDRLGVVGSLSVHPTVRVIDDSRPLAFCAGYLRPQVYVSRRSLEVLSGQELEAVVAHEHHHRRVRDPLRFAFARVIGRALFFLPVLATLGDRYGMIAELNADDAAVRASAGEKGPLASAMLAFEESGPLEGAGISPERVDRLLGESGHWRLPLARVAASVLVLSSLAALILRASELASARASLNLPFLTSRPCLVVLTILLALVAGILSPSRRPGGRIARMLHPHLSS
jgi:hypothetical protein